MRVRQLLRHPLAPLCLFTLVMSACFAAYVVAGSAPSPAWEFWTSLVWAPLAIFWIRADARRRHLPTPCVDFGMLCYLFFPVSAVWYCLWSRGPWRGVALIALLACLLIAPSLVALVLWTTLNGPS